MYIVYFKKIFEILTITLHLTTTFLERTIVSFENLFEVTSLIEVYLWTPHLIIWMHFWLLTIIKNKYTNPARGILDFCQQKLWPLPCSQSTD